MISDREDEGMGMVKDESEAMGELLASLTAKIEAQELELRKLRAKRARLRSAVKALEKVEAG